MIDLDYSNTHISAVIDEYVHSERDRAIMKRRLCDKVLFEKLAEEFGLSVRHIKRIVYKNQERVLRHI